ncbi:MAG: hypothetical protein ABIH72_01190 [archaeon]
MDYGFPERRKTKRDKKKKRLYRVYKKGGKFRSQEIEKKEEK